MSIDSNNSNNNPYLKESIPNNYSNLDLWKYPHQNLNSNANQNSLDITNNISFGEVGVKKTYVSLVQEDKDKNKKQNKRNISDNNLNNENNNIIYYNNNLSINNNNLNYYNNGQIQINMPNISNGMNKVMNSLNNNLNIENSIPYNSVNAERPNPFYGQVNVPNPFYVPFELNNNLNNQQNVINNISSINSKNNINNNSISQNRPIQPLYNISNHNNEFNNFSKYKKASLTGLENLGNISYLNSVLQLICSIKPFANYFLNNGEFFIQNNYCLSFVMHRLCVHLYPENGERQIYSAKHIIENLNNYNKVYGDLTEKNPNELILFLLDILNEELNPMKMNSYNNKVMNHSIENDFSNIYNQFIWNQKKENECGNCSKTFILNQNFSTFDLNIIKVTQFANLKNPEKIKIEDCMDFYTMKKIKNNFCQNCQKYTQISTSMKISSSPKMFIFLIDLPYNSKINFIIEPILNMEKYIENQTSPKNYELNGIVFFDKKKNKYNTFCISPVDRKWYLFDDKDVQLYEYNKFMSSYSDNNEDNYKPCILLYRGIDNIF